MIKILERNAQGQNVEEQILGRIKELGVDTKTYSPLNIERVRGAHISDDAPMDEPLYIAYYVSTLSEYIETGLNKDVPKPIKKQLSKALDNGELCVYLSVIYHMLCSFAVKDVECDLYLGYVDTKWKFNELEAMFGSSNLTIPDVPVKNFHSCVTVDAKVVDVCYLFQNEGMDALGEILYGEYPDGAKMWGWKMNHAMPHLVERYAKMSGIDIGVFVNQHCSYFSSVISNKITSLKKASN